MRERSNLYRLFVAACALAFVAGVGTLRAAEGPAPSPFSGRVHALAVNPETNALFLGASLVYRSDDGGRTWAKVDGIPKAKEPANVAAIAIDPRNPDVMYASGHGIAVVKSADGGRTWTRIAAGLPHDSTEAFAIDAQDSSKLYVWVLGAGLYRSQDAGASWQKVDGGPRGQEIRSLVSLNEPTGMGGLWLYAGLDVGVVKSPDCFCGWDRLANQGLPPNKRVYSLAADPARPSVVYAGLPDGIFKTEDAGNSWSKIADHVPDAIVAVHPRHDRLQRARLHVPDAVVAVHPRNAGQVYAAGSDGSVFASRDAGGTWRRVR